MIRGRFAPSPTGYLHLGNARTALVAWCAARQAGGQWVIRIEDIDRDRSKAEYVTANLRELRWLGLTWDEGAELGGPYGPYEQHKRTEFYEAALRRLEQQPNIQLFNCYLSRKDLRELASAPHAHGAAPVYGSAERELNAHLKDSKQQAGKQPSLRLAMPNKAISFTDDLAGHQVLSVAEAMGDIVLKRADGMWAYHLAVVVDDIAMNISQVVRGDDLLTSTAAHLFLYEALDATPPSYLHVPLLLDEHGERIAKRRGGYTLTALQEQDVLAERVLGLLAYSLNLQPHLKLMSLAEVLEQFSIQRIPKKPFQLTAEHLSWLTT
ncbi:MAG: tRNA glutamyl-Q(34) synthetase GluQRS [Deinococcota bacterium]